MRSLKHLTLVLAFNAMPLAATQQPTTMNEAVDRIVAQERVEIQLLRRYSPLVETYIQYLRDDKKLGDVPDGDKYFLGRANLANGVELEPLSRDASTKQKLIGGLGEFFSTEFLPRGFLQMIYLDMDGFDRQHYKFEYIRREFLGEVRCLVFDVDPLPRAGKGRFAGRIWVEDQDYHVVRFNGAYGGYSLTSNYLNFESWRINVAKGLWLPAFVYSEGASLHDTKARGLGFKAFNAQTRLWGYDVRYEGKEQELGKLFVETSTPMTDQSDTANDYSPIQAERSWGRTAEDNVIERLEGQGLIAPTGEVDKVLETVVNNLEVTNNLEIQPEVRCRVLMTSTLESFTVGHTIILSRGLIDVLPDEASLAAILAHELGHVVLRHHTDTQYAFFNRLRFDEKGTFRHFDFARTKEEEQAADKKGIELLKNSPYKEQSGAAQVFLQAVKNHSKEIPNLLSPHLTDSWINSYAVYAGQPVTNPAANVIEALPLGGRIKVDPWNDHLTILKAESVGSVAEDEKKSFQITPFVIYLTRQREIASAQTPGDTATKLDLDTRH
jgi:Peptidase family M48